MQFPLNFPPSVTSRPVSIIRLIGAVRDLLPVVGDDRVSKI